VGNRNRYSWVIYVYKDHNDRWVRSILSVRHFPEAGTFGPALSAFSASSLADGDPDANLVRQNARRGFIRNVGQVNILRQIHGTWVETSKILPNHPRTKALFGFPIVAWGKELVVEARKRIYVYRDKSDRWIRVGVLSAHRLAFGFGKYIPFGSPVALSSSWVAFGDPVLLTRGKRKYLGAVYLVRQESKHWIETTLTAPPYIRHEPVGLVTGMRSVALSGSWLAVGAKNYRTARGLVYFYHLGHRKSGRQDHGKPTSCP